HQLTIESNRVRTFFKGMLIAALNVLPIAYFCGMNAAWNVSGWIKFQLWEILVFVIASGLGTFAMLYMYVFYFDKLENKTNNFYRYSDYILSGLMGLLLIITLICLFYIIFLLIIIVSLCDLCNFTDICNKTLFNCFMM